MERNPGNNMIIASILRPIESHVATELSFDQKASKNLQEAPITDSHFKVSAKLKEFCHYDTGRTEEKADFWNTRKPRIAKNQQSALAL